MPRDGTISSISAYFTSADLNIGVTNLTIQAQVYTSATPNDVFTPVGSPVTLVPSIPGIVALGVVCHGVLPLNIAVTTETRVAVIFSVTSSAALVADALGYASAGLSID